jgi:hypothetical protein
MPTYKNLRAGGIMLDQLVLKRNDKGEIISRSPERFISPGAEFIADEAEIPKAWFGSATHPKFVELVSTGEKAKLYSPLDDDKPVTASDDDEPKSDALVPPERPPMDPVGRTTSPGRSPAPELVAAAVADEAAAAKEQTDKVAKPASAPRADKPAK